MKLPIEPELHQYGIAHDSISIHKRVTERYKDQIIYFCGLIFFTSILWIAYYDSSPALIDIVLNITAGALFAAMFFWPAGIIAFIILDSVVDMFYSLTSANYRSVKKFNAAHSQYITDINKYYKHSKSTAESYWKSLTDLHFKEAFGNLCSSNGYEVEYPIVVGSPPVDIVLRKNGLTTIVQCKLKEKELSTEAINDLLSRLKDYDADKAIIAGVAWGARPNWHSNTNKTIRIYTLDDIVELQVLNGL